MNVKVRTKIGFTSQVYAPPRAESVAMSDEGLLCASIVEAVGTEQVVTFDGGWGQSISGGGTEEVSTTEGIW